MTASEPAESNGMPGTAAPPFPTVDLFGMPFVDAPSEQAVADVFARWSPSPRSTEGCTLDDECLPLICTPNIDIVVQLQDRDASELREKLQKSCFVLPDGWPIVSVSKLAGTPLRQRIAGSSVFASWWPQVVADGRRVAMLLSSELVADGLRSEHPAAAAFVAPMIATDDESIGALADDFVKIAVAAEAEFIVFGIGHPKDALVALAVIERWPADLDLPLSFCLGASAEFYLGLRRRAPGWAQRMRMEWVVRFVQEPRRMFHRYFVRDAAFLPIAVREIAKVRRS